MARDASAASEATERGRSGSLYVALDRKRVPGSTSVTESGLLSVPGITSTPARAASIHEIFSSGRAEWIFHVLGHSEDCLKLNRALQSLESEDVSLKCGDVTIRQQFIAVPFAEFRIFRSSLSTAYHPRSEERVDVGISAIDLSALRAEPRTEILRWAIENRHLGPEGCTK